MLPGRDGDVQASAVPTLADLISARKTERGWSYQQLADRAHGAVSRQRWQQLGTGVRIKEFPEPATIQAIADALEVDVTLVVLGVARSIGFAVRTQDSSLAAMLPPGADQLNDEQRDAVLAVVRAMAPRQLAGAKDEDTSTQGAPSDSTTDGKAGTRGTPMKPKHPDNVRKLTRPNQPEEVDEEFDDTAPPPEALDFVARETPPGYKKGYDIDRGDEGS